MLSSVAKRLASASSKQAALRSQARSASTLEKLLYDAPSQNALTEEFPGVPARSGAAAAPTPMQVSTLNNGLKVASIDQQGATASIGVYIKAGSRYEPVPGTSHVLEHLAFRSTARRSALKIQRDVEDLGAVVSAKTSREAFVYSTEALRGAAEDAAGILAECITAPKLTYWEVNEQKAGLAELVEEAAADPSAAIVEGVHAAAFGAESGLGHNLYARSEDLEDVSSDVLRSFLGSQFTAANMVVVGTNLPHTTVMDIADKYFLTVPEGVKGAATSAKSSFVGGESLIRSRKTGIAHVALALPAPALAAANFHALGVLQTLLGGTGAHGGAAGQVQLGYHRQSRIARSVHNEAHSFVRSLTSFAFPYTDAGVLGLAGTCADHEAGRLVDVMAGFLKDAAGATAITPAELDRAKRQYKLAYLLDVESRGGARDDIGHALLLTGARAAPAEVMKAIDAVTAADVAGVAKAALASGKPALAAIGSLSNIPRYDLLTTMLK